MRSNSRDVLLFKKKKRRKFKKKKKKKEKSKKRKPRVARVLREYCESLTPMQEARSYSPLIFVKNRIRSHTYKRCEHVVVSVVIHLQLQYL